MLKVEVAVTDQEKARLERVANRPPLSEVLNLHDFEVGFLISFLPKQAGTNRTSQFIARQVMPEKAWAYYSSAADDEITNRENHAAYHRIWWRPRILRDVTNVDWSTQILGHRSSMPLYIVSLFCLITSPMLTAWSQTATALGKLGHPDGELNLTKAAAKHGVIQMVRRCLSVEHEHVLTE